MGAVSSYRRLINAIKQNNKEYIYEVIEQTPEVFYQFKPGKNAFTFACKLYSLDLDNKDKREVVISILNGSKIKNLNEQKVRGRNFIDDAFMECIRLDQLHIVKMFVQNSFDIHKVVLTVNKKNEGFNICCFKQQVEKIDLTSIDLAILAGHYQIAYYFYEISYFSMKIKTQEEYEQLGKIFQYRYVDYRLLIECLTQRVEPQKIEDLHVMFRLCDKSKIKIQNLKAMIGSAKPNNREGYTSETHTDRYLMGSHKTGQ